MPEPNSFLLRAWASDPLVSMSLLPKKTQLDPKLEPVDSISASSLEQELEVSDYDLPSSVVEELEIDVGSLKFTFKFTLVTCFR